ncbi:MAG TPA: rhodanese-like domain-containing protein [Chitinophagaceae bacterium]
MKKLFIFITAITISLLMQDVAAQSTTPVSEKKFARLMKKQNAVLLDVRTKEEYQEGHIPGAVLIDVNKQDDFLQQVQKLDKSKRYLLYCRSGKRSEKALVLMKENGFRKIFHLEDGFEGWDGNKEK